MAVLILVLVIFLMFALAKRGKNAREREAFNKLSANNKEKVVARRQQKQRETDELITVILPTIKNK